MKDLRFTGGVAINATIRIDAINIENGSQVTVLETYGLNDRRPEQVDEVAEQALSNFLKVNHTLQEFIDVAEEYNLELVISNSDGSDEKVLRGELFTFTINPTPSDAVVTINSEVQTSIEVTTGTEVEYSVSKEGYTTQTDTVTVTADTTLEITLVVE